VVDRVACLQETSELGSDDVYIVTFRGNTIAPFDSNVGVHGPVTYGATLIPERLRTPMS
jgi:hypothetical protein